MTDERLRELERRWKETRAAQDEAAYLVERVRSGDLDRERLWLAACVGDEASREALGDGSWSLADSRSRLLERASAGDLGEDPDYLMAYLGDESKRESYGIGRAYWPTTASELGVVTLEVVLIELSPVALVRALLAVAWTTRSTWERVPAEVLESYPAFAESALRDAFEAAEAWAAKPTADAAVTAYDAADTANIVAARGEGSRWSKAAFLVSSAAYAAAADMLGLSLGERVGGLLKAERFVGDVLRGIIAADLVPWALGYRDPVRMRVAKRGSVDLRLSEDFEG